MKVTLNDAAFAEIAEEVMESLTLNVVRHARDHYNYEWQDGDFDRLRDEHDVFKCVDCGYWKETSELDADSTDDLCADCSGTNQYEDEDDDN